MARAKSKTFMDMVGSPLTLTPFVLGLGSAIVLWAASDRQQHMAAFLAIAGSLGGVGTLLTLLILNAKGTDPALARRRREMLAGLEELADAGKFTPSPEADQPAAAALAERG